MRWIRFLSQKAPGEQLVDGNLGLDPDIEEGTPNQQFVVTVVLFTQQSSLSFGFLKRPSKSRLGTTCQRDLWSVLTLSGQRGAPINYPYGESCSMHPAIRSLLWFWQKALQKPPENNLWLGIVVSMSRGEPQSTIHMVEVVPFTRDSGESFLFPEKPSGWRAGMAWLVLTLKELSQSLKLQVNVYFVSEAYLLMFIFDSNNISKNGVKSQIQPSNLKNREEATIQKTLLVTLILCTRGVSWTFQFLSRPSGTTRIWMVLTDRGLFRGSKRRAGMTD
jgi:hypothetical protein